MSLRQDTEAVSLSESDATGDARPTKIFCVLRKKFLLFGQAAQSCPSDRGTECHTESHTTHRVMTVCGESESTCMTR